MIASLIPRPRPRESILCDLEDLAALCLHNDAATPALWHEHVQPNSDRKASDRHWLRLRRLLVYHGLPHREVRVEVDGGWTVGVVVGWRPGWVEEVLGLRPVDVDEDAPCLPPPHSLTPEERAFRREALRAQRRGHTTTSERAIRRRARRLCACGCGTVIVAFDRRLRPVRFADGHAGRVRA